MKTRISCTLLFFFRSKYKCKQLDVLNQWFKPFVISFLFAGWFVCLFYGAFVCVCVFVSICLKLQCARYKTKRTYVFFCLFHRKKMFCSFSSINVQFFIILNLFSVSVVDVADLMLLLFGIITLLGHSSLFFVSFFVSFNI